MAKPKPIQARLSDLTTGQPADFFAPLAEKNKAPPAKARPYYACRFRDARRTVAFMVWGDGPWFAVVRERLAASANSTSFAPSYGEHERDGPQITELVAIRPAADADLADGFDPAQLVECSRYDPETMLIELKALATAQIADEAPPQTGPHAARPARRAVEAIARHARPLPPVRRRPAGTHPGGERSAVQLAERDSSLLYGAETTAEPRSGGRRRHPARHRPRPGVRRRSDGAVRDDPRQAGGAPAAWRDLVRDAAREIGDVNPELVQILQHIVLTHLGLPEWGSPRLPLVPECLSSTTPTTSTPSWKCTSAA